MPGLLADTARFAIRVYQKCLSPFIGQQCRFSPTCSCYTYDALDRHGFLKGSVLGLMRIFNCHPFSRRGWIDAVPEVFAWAHLFRYKPGTGETMPSKDKRRS